MIEFEMEKAVKAVKGHKAGLVAVQVPEGLKARLPQILEEIEKKTGAKAFAFVEPCFGACGLKDVASKELGADLLIHFGHTRFFSKEAIETVYVSIKYKADARAVSVLGTKIAEEFNGKGFKKVGLCGTIQFSGHAALLERELGKKGFNVFLGKGKNVEKGQVLGCNYSSVKAVEEKVDAVVFVGDGLFHPIGLGFAVKKPVFIANPVEGDFGELSTQRDLFLRKRIAMIEKVKEAKSIAIWASTKKGQQRLGLARGLKKKFEEKGKKAFVFTSNLLLPEYVAGIKVDAIVCTACPRIAFDDSSSFRQAIINPVEARIVLGEKRLEDYEFDELC